MATVTLDERVNLEAVKYLMSMPKSRWKSYLSTDKGRKFDVEYNKVREFLNGQLDGTGITRTYHSLLLVRTLGGSLTTRDCKECKSVFAASCV